MLNPEAGAAARTGPEAAAGTEISFRNSIGPCVQRQTLFTGDWTFLPVVGKGGKHQKTSIGAGLKVTASRLVEGRETIREQNNQRFFTLERCTGNFFFPGADTWRN